MANRGRAVKLEDEDVSDSEVEIVESASPSPPNTKTDRKSAQNPKKSRTFSVSSNHILPMTPSHLNLQKGQSAAELLDLTISSGSRPEGHVKSAMMVKSRQGTKNIQVSSRS